MSVNKYTGFLTDRAAPEQRAMAVDVDYDAVGRRVIGAIDRFGAMPRRDVSARVSSEVSAAPSDIEKAVDYLLKLGMVTIDRNGTVALTELARNALTAFSFR
jgi:hypothetical protein